MPSKFQLAAWLLVGASLTACSGRMPSTPANTTSNTQQTSPTQSTAVTPSNTPFTITRGQTFSIGLNSAGDGGYQWVLAENYDRSLLRLKGKRTGTVPAGAPLGKFADEIYDFDGLAPGRTTVTFELRRSWEEPTKAPADSKTFPVTVQ